MTYSIRHAHRVDRCSSHAGRLPCGGSGPLLCEHPPMITRLQSVLTAAPAPSIDTTIRIVHYDAHGDVVFWCGYTNGHDGQGWTADESEALTFTTYAAASTERKVAKRWHPKMRITLRGNWMVTP